MILLKLIKAYEKRYLFCSTMGISKEENCEARKGRNNFEIMKLSDKQKDTVIILRLNYWE